MAKLNVLVAGCTGYIGIQLIKLLINHKRVKIKYLCGNSSVGKKISFFDKSIKKKLPKITKFNKNNNSLIRKLNSDISIFNKVDEKINLKGRSLMLIGNVGHLMTNPAILYENNKEIPEGLMDAMFTTLIAIYDLNNDDISKNSSEKSVYIVKPKMHGPEEVALTNDIFSKVEEILNLPK